MSPSVRLIALLAYGSVLGAQEAPPASAILVYTREPLRIPVECRAEDFAAADLHCSEEEPCQVFLELTSVEAVGPKVFVTGNLHTSSATLASVVLFSDDGGGRWQEPVRRFPSASGEAVQFLNEQHGWVAVQPHRHFPLDPFFMSTSDGGARWQMRRIWSEEGRAGLVQQFRFDTPQHGFVLIDRSQSGRERDRYELYETMNSGASWLLKESSPRPIEPKWPERRSSEWRLRTDAKAGTYELERRVGAAWRRMANFRTEVAACRELTGPAVEKPDPAAENPNPDPAAPPDAGNPGN
jgi:hypothetical protein